MSKSIYISIGFVLIMISSCIGQVKQDSTRTITKAEKTIPTYKDGLFFLEGQLCQHVRKIFQDSKDNLWFGTNVYDLMLYDGNELQYITEKDGFSGGRVTGFAEDSIGNLWIATGLGLNKYDGKHFTLYAEEDGLQNSEIWSMHLDQKGIIWLGHNEGLSHFDGKSFTNFEVPQPQIENPDVIFSPTRITAITADKKDNLWLGTDGFGICKYDGESFSHFTEQDGLCDNTICEMMHDSKGDLWIGTFSAGISRYDGSTFVNYTKDSIVHGIEVGGLYEDHNGDIWFAPENNGVYRYDGDRFIHYHEDQGLKGSILSIYRDKQNRLWLGGWGGLFRYHQDRITSVTKEGPWAK